MNLAQLLHHYLDAWNRNDAQAIIDMFSPDAVYIDVYYNETFTGKALHEHVCTFAFEGCEHMQYVVQNQVAFTETGIAFQYVMQGKNRHGEWVEMDGADFLEFRDGKIIRVQEYYNWDQVLEAEHIAPAPKYKKSGLQAAQIERYKHHLEQLMEHDKRYRDNKLTLRGLAADMGISVNHLSQVINSAFGVNFFEFVNRHRIAEAQQLLALSPNKQGLILSIALSVGFSSSATFYAAFKKYLGVTPTQYRRLHHKSNT